MKKCKDCGREKPEAEFYVKIRATGRLFPYCKVCHGERCKASYLKKHEANKARQRQYAKEHREQSTEQMRRWRAANPERAKEINRKADAKRKPQKKAYREANAEHIRRQTAEYRERNRDKIRAADARYREENRELINARYREWRKDNPESDRAIHARWKRANKELVNAATHRRRATLRGCSEHWTGAEWEALKAACHHTCLCCGRQEPEVKLTVDHVVPVNKGGDNTIANVQPLCKSCNSAKHTADHDYRE